MKVVLLALLLGLAGCDPDPGALGWVELTETRHAEADRLIDEGQPQEARRMLEAIVEQMPTGDPNRRPILQDVHFRLARLALGAGELEGAAHQVDAGLALGEPADLFTANLLIVRAAVHERRGHGAAAAADYERALAINEALLREVLPSP